MGVEMGIVHLGIAAVLVASCWVPQDWITWDDATLLTLVYTNQLELDEATAAKVRLDLAAIREEFPARAGGYFTRPWEPGRVFVKPTPSAWRDYEAGRSIGLDSLLTELQMIPCGSELQMIEIVAFRPLHSGLAAEAFAALDNVEWAIPWAPMTIDGGTVEILELGTVSRYRFSRGWGDCPSGCISRHFSEFSITDGTVQMTASWGSVETHRESWGAIKSRF